VAKQVAFRRFDVDNSGTITVFGTRKLENGQWQWQWQWPPLLSRGSLVFLGLIDSAQIPKIWVNLITTEPESDRALGMMVFIGKSSQYGRNSFRLVKYCNLPRKIPRSIILLIHFLELG
jgi:hypothetical protein